MRDRKRKQDKTRIFKNEVVQMHSKPFYEQIEMISKNNRKEDLQVAERYCCGCLEQSDLKPLVTDTREELIKITERDLKDQLFACSKCEEFLKVSINFNGKCLQSLEFLDRLKEIKPEFDTSINDIVEQPEAIKGPKQKNILNCNKWENNFTDSEEYKTHISSHTSKLQCNFCQKEYNSRTLILSHLMTKHFHGKRCYKCRKLFWDNKKFEEHMKWEKDKPTEKKICDICGYEAVNKQYLFNHKSQKHSVGPFRCSICDKEFAKRSILQYHNRHTHGERHNECKFCSKKFIEAGELRKHLTTHNEKRRIPCKMCDKVYSTQLSLKNHMIVYHTENFNHQCKICERSFKLPVSLKKHYFSHIAKRPFCCHLCPTGYYRVEYLLKHYDDSHQVKMNLKETRAVMVRVDIRKEMKKEGINI